MSSTATPVAGPALAVAGLGAALDQLTMVGGDELAALGRDGLLEVIKEFERIRNRMAVVDHAIVAACETSGLAEHHGLRSTATLLANSLLIGPGEARARVHAAEQLRPGLSPTGAPIPTTRPVLAAAAEGGTISQERMDTALRALERAERAPTSHPTTSTPPSACSPRRRRGSDRVTSGAQPIGSSTTSTPMAGSTTTATTTRTAASPSGRSAMARSASRATSPLAWGRSSVP